MTSEQHYKRRAERAERLLAAHRREFINREERALVVTSKEAYAHLAAWEAEELA